MAGRRELLIIALICGVFGVLGWVFYAALFSQVPLQDFMVFYTASRAWLEGNAALLDHGAAFTAQINERLTPYFSRMLDLHPWVYPPLFLLLVAPLGLLPFLVAYGTFMAGGFAALMWAVGRLAHHPARRRLAFASLLLAPTTAFTAAVGQNAFLTTALMVGGGGMLWRKPLLGGALLGVLSFKPQLWLMVPVALVAARQWRALVAALGTAAALALASLIMFGAGRWFAWFGLIVGTNPEYQSWLPVGRLNGQSAYTEALLLGASTGMAQTVQALALLLAAWLVWRAFRAPHAAPDLQTAVLLSATILAAPHVANYDATMLTVAVILFLCRALEDGFRPGDSILVIGAWSIELLDPPQMLRRGLATPFVILAFIAVLLRRLRSSSET